MGDIENRLGTTITMNNNAAIDERRSKWKFADFCVCCCIFIFIIVLFVAALVSDIKNRRLVFDTKSAVMFIITVIIFCLVSDFVCYSDRKKRLKAALLQEGFVRTSSGSHPPLV